MLKTAKPITNDYLNGGLLMKSEYNVSGDIVFEIMKKQAFVWRYKDALYVVAGCKCKKILEDEALRTSYLQYEQAFEHQDAKPTLGQLYEEVANGASLIINSEDFRGIQMTETAFSDLGDQEDESLNIQLTRYVNAHSNFKKSE
jgi:hypothetical protein